MAESKIERAIRTYREAADAYEDLPPTLHRVGLFGNLLPLESLRNEADWLESFRASMIAGNEPAGPQDLPA